MKVTQDSSYGKIVQRKIV